MESKVNYTVVGIFVLVLGFALIAGFVWLSSEKHHEVYHHYIVRLEDEVSGLSVQSPVRYKGVPVGFVEKISIDKKNPQLVRLMLNVEEDTPITTSTVAILKTQGITGVDYVDLSNEKNGSPPLRRQPGEEYPVIQAKPSLLLELSEVIPEITKKLSGLSNSVAKLLSERNQQAVSSSLQDMAKFTKVLSKNSKDLDDSLKSLHVLLTNSAKASKSLPQAMKAMNRSLAEIHKAAQSLNAASQEAGKVMQDTRVVVNGTSQELMPSTQELLLRLNVVSQNLETFSKEVADNPSIILRGRRETSFGPGESR